MNELMSIMDWGKILTEAIVFILTVVFGFVWMRYIKPFIQQNNLTEVANIVVRAAEAAYGAGRGSEKLAYCIEQINETYKITLDHEKIVQAVEAAWNTMNTDQIASGEKKLPENTESD